MHDILVQLYNYALPIIIDLHVYHYTNLTFVSHYTNLTFVSECVCESGRSTEAIRPEIKTNL